MNSANLLGLLSYLFRRPHSLRVIWAVGLTRPGLAKTLKELPESHCRDPRTADGMILAARDERSDMDYDTRTCSTPSPRTGTTPRQC